MTLNRRHHVRVSKCKEFLFLLAVSSAVLAEPAQEPVRNAITYGVTEPGDDFTRFGNLAVKTQMGMTKGG